MEVEERKKYFPSLRSATRTQKVLAVLAFFDVLLVGFAVFAYLSAKTVSENKAEDGLMPSVTSVPSISPSVLPSSTPTNAVVKTPTMTSTPSATLTPTPPPDTTAPEIIRFVGLDEGATVAYSSSCIPVQIHDNVSPFSTLMSRFKLDGAEWTSWGYDAEYCLSNIGEGPHSLSVEVRDQAGNVGSATRNFTVQKS